MRALRIHSYGASPQLDDVEPPSRPGPGEITVDVSAVGVGTWDLGVLSGRLSRLVPPERLPAVLGAEFAGRVRALGVGVEGFDLGDRVMGNPGLTGAWAERLTLPATACGRAPERVDDVHASALPVSFLTAWKALDLLDVGPGATLLVLGAGGGVGAAVLQLARVREIGAFATARAVDLDRVRGLGAAGAADSVEALGVEFDAVLDLMGGGSLERALAHVRAPRRVVSTIADQDVTGAPTGVTVEFLRMRSDTPTLEAIASLVDEGRLSQPVETVVRFEDAGDALAMLGGGSPPGKLVLRVD